MNAKVKIWLITLPLLGLLSVMANAGNRRGELALKFKVLNLGKLELQNGLSEVTIADDGSAYPGNANLQAKLLRIFPAINGIKDSDDESSTIELIQTFRIKKQIPGFRVTLKPEHAGRKPLPPGYYRIDLAFFRGQKKELRKLIVAHDKPVAASRIFFVGTKKHTLEGIHKDIGNLREFRQDLEKRTRRFQDKYREFVKGPIKGKRWVQLINSDCHEFCQQMSVLRTLSTEGVMADAYNEIECAYVIYKQNNLGSVMKSLDVLSKPMGEEAVQVIEEKMRNLDKTLQMLDSTLLLLMVDGQMMRHIPLNLVYYINDAMASFEEYYAGFAADMDGTAYQRTALENDWQSMLQSARLILGEYQNEYSTGTADKIMELMYLYGADLKNIEPVLIPKNYPREFVLRRLLNLQSFMEIYQHEKESFLHLMALYINKVETLQQSYAKFVQAGKSPAAIKSLNQKRKEEIELLRRRIMHVLKLYVEFPEKQIKELLGIKDEASENEEPFPK
ncbi:hypothetical protein ACFL54_06480 [Planctomycetota bacterium]